MSSPGTAIVTGGAGGIGRAVCDLLLRRGWTVWSLDRSANPDAGVISRQCDVTDEASLLALADEIGTADALIMCAGVNLGPRNNTLAKVTLDAWTETIAVNLIGTMLSTKCFSPILRTGGAIVTLGSIAALRALPGSDAYTASKGAIVSLTRCWTVEFSGRRIRVNCVCPGLTDTRMLTEIRNSVPGGRIPDLPQQRTADAAEVAGGIGFLVSESTSYLSGAIIPVDGGATAHGAGMPFPTAVALDP